jgi:hypothetical protein
VGRNISLSWEDFGYAAHLVGKRRTGGKVSRSKIGCAWSLLTRRSGLSVRNGAVHYEQLFRPMMDYSF